MQSWDYLKIHKQGEEIKNMRDLPECKSLSSPCSNEVGRAELRRCSSAAGVSFLHLVEKHKGNWELLFREQCLIKSWFYSLKRGCGYCVRHILPYTAVCLSYDTVALFVSPTNLITKRGPWWEGSNVTPDLSLSLQCYFLLRATCVLHNNSSQKKQHISTGGE